MSPRAEGRRVQKMSDDTAEVGFYNPHDGLKGRDGGPYLDHVERQHAEVNRARLEGREPADLQGVLPATAGTPLVIAQNVIDNSYTSNPSMSAKPGFAAVLTDETLSDRRDGKPWGEQNKVSVASPVSVGTVDLRTEEPVEDDAVDSEDVEHNDANLDTTVSPLENE